MVRTDRPGAVIVHPRDGDQPPSWVRSAHSSCAPTCVVGGKRTRELRTDILGGRKAHPRATDRPPGREEDASRCYGPTRLLATRRIPRRRDRDTCSRPRVTPMVRIDRPGANVAHTRDPAHNPESWDVSIRASAPASAAVVPGQARECLPRPSHTFGPGRCRSSCAQSGSLPSPVGRSGRIPTQEHHPELSERDRSGVIEQDGGPYGSTRRWAASRVAAAHMRAPPGLPAIPPPSPSIDQDQAA